MPKEPVIPEWMVLGEDGKVRPEKHDICGLAHPTVQMGMGPCPNCKRLTMRWYCRDLRCAGIVVSDGHKAACGKA